MWCIKLEDGQVKLQSRLEQEEDAKAALLGRIQRLTKLILVSKPSQSSRFPHRPGLRRRHSFGEEEVWLSRTKIFSPSIVFFWYENSDNLGTSFNLALC